MTFVNPGKGNTPYNPWRNCGIAIMTTCSLVFSSLMEKAQITDIWQGE